MDFNHLKTFLEVAKNKSFSRAAEKLNVTQPSISAQIRSLETVLGRRLFERGGGKVTLTAAGRVFEPFAEECMSRLHHIHLTIGDLDHSPRGALVVCANESTALYVLPSFFGRFKKLYPRVSLNIMRAERIKTIESVLNREADFGIVSLPVKDPRLLVEVIHEDELTLVAPSHHPLASATELVSIPELAKCTLLLPPQGRRRETLDLLFAAQGVSPRVTMELDSSELLKRLILADLGIGFLPRINVLDELRSGKLKEIAVQGVQLSRDLGLISHRDHILTRAGQAFYELTTGRLRRTRMKPLSTREGAVVN